ncbi:hypothetical protein BH10BDE1_BH10BDE1_26920 [soil metagenome]
MKHKTSILFMALTILLIAQTGCSSYFKRQDCEATNWYEYGKKVALTGRRLSGDQFVVDCRRVEAEIREADLDRGFKEGMDRYCDASQVFNLGKSGEFFSAEMCDGANLRQLQERHKVGVVEYCQKSNGYTAGAGGKDYNKICPKELERAFLPEFNRGRKKYLTVVVLQIDGQVNNLDREILSLENQRNYAHVEESRLRGATSVVVERTVDPATGALREQFVQRQSEEQKRAADDASWKIRNLESQISSKRQEQIKLREHSRNIQLEAVALDDKGEG